MHWLLDYTLIDFWTAFVAQGKILLGDKYAIFSMKEIVEIEISESKPILFVRIPYF